MFVSYMCDVWCSCHIYICGTFVSYMCDVSHEYAMPHTCVWHVTHVRHECVTHIWHPHHTSHIYSLVKNSVYVTHKVSVNFLLWCGVSVAYIGDMLYMWHTSDMVYSCDMCVTLCIGVSVAYIGDMLYMWHTCDMGIYWWHAVFVAYVRHGVFVWHGVFV